MSAREKRWVESLIALAQQRGDPPAAWRRAVDLVEQLNIAPWVALAVTEGLVPLVEAAVLDRAARCRELPAAVLDKRLSLAELRTRWPYAPYLLAAELMGRPGAERWPWGDALEVARALLSRERRLSGDGTPLPVRQHPLEVYAAAAARIRAMQAQEGLDLRLAIEVETGLLDIQAARRCARRGRRALGRPGAKRSVDGQKDNRDAGTARS